MRWTMREDELRSRKGDGPRNLAALRRTRGRCAARSRAPAHDDDFLLEMVRAAANP